MRRTYGAKIRLTCTNLSESTTVSDTFRNFMKLRKTGEDHPVLLHHLNIILRGTPVTDGHFLRARPQLTLEAKSASKVDLRTHFFPVGVAVFHFRFPIFFKNNIKKRISFRKHKEMYADSLENIKLKFFFFFDSFFSVFQV